jgi:putative zinc finger/helix-turn-helix YgiT family protein
MIVMTDNSTGNTFFAPDRCIECGDPALEVRVLDFVVDHNGQQRTISDEQTHCRACGNVSYIGAQVSRHELAVAAAVREIDGLLSTDELKAIRAKYCLKQTDLERMLSTGPKTWTRWERGKVPQSKTADKLIRLLAENASLVRQLMRDANVDNDEAWATVAQAEVDAQRAAWLSVQKEVAAGQA